MNPVAVEEPHEVQVLSHYIANTNECVDIKLLTGTEDFLRELLEAEGNVTKKSPTAVARDDSQVLSYKPEISCQVFGCDERVFGYKNLRITIYYTCGSLHIYFTKRYTSTIEEDYKVMSKENIEADDVRHTLSTRLMTSQVHSNQASFEAELSKERTFIPIGHVVDEFSINCFDQSTKHFVVFKANADDPHFAAYHERMQTFLLWANESPSFVNIANDCWEFFMAYEKLPLTETEPDSPRPFMYSFVGFSAVYRYGYHLDLLCPCISQFLVLRPYMKTDLPGRILDTVYNHYKRQPTFEITFEEPTDFLTNTRDILDCKLCQRLKVYSSDNLKLGWNKQMAKNARRVFRITASQSRRVYEILRLKSINRQTNSAEYDRFRQEVILRLDEENQQEQSCLETIYEEDDVIDELQIDVADEPTTPDDVQINILREQYEDLEDEYMRVISLLS